MSITVSKTFDTEAAAAAWLTGKPAGAASTGTASTSTTKDKPADVKKPKNTREAMVAVMNKLKSDVSSDACRAIIEKASGKQQKMADLPDEFIDTVFDAATKALADKAAADAAAADDV